VSAQAWFYQRERWQSRNGVSAEERFYSKLFHEPNTGCHLWGGAVDKDGYGKFQVHLAPEMKQVHVRAHRFALALELGRWVQGNVLHSCDTPACCNPEHLREGTHAENIADKVRKGRQARGETHKSRTRPDSVARGSSHGNATIDEATALRIVTLLRFGMRSQAAVARAVGVPRTLVDNIKRGKTWRHVAGGSL
jgi:hypothetical protein